MMLNYPDEINDKNFGNKVKQVQWRLLLLLLELSN